MSEAEKQEKLIEKEEISKAFDTGFLEQMQKFARIARDHRVEEQYRDKVESYIVQCIIKFSVDDGELTYEDLEAEDKIKLTISPCFPAAEVKDEAVQEEAK